MTLDPKFCYECQLLDPSSSSAARPSWKPATAQCKTQCGNRVCESRHPLYHRGSPVEPGQPGKCGECDYQDYLNSPGGM